MGINIKINCDNASLNDGSETVADILRKLAVKLQEQELAQIEDTKVRDINGNTILWMEVKRD